MNLLLDTHIWLWLLSDPARLGRQTLRELQDLDNQIWLSPISTWEALTLNFKGRIQLSGNLRDWVRRATAGTHEAPLTHEIALAAREITLHQDPADRILVATALVLDLTLVSADTHLIGLPIIRTLANR